MHFHTIAQAAASIAAKLYPDDTSKRQELAERYKHIIYNALCKAEVVGRDPESRMPIDHNRLGAIMALHSCLISERDLNAWLDVVGIGVQVDGKGASSPRPQGSLEFYPTAQVASALAPFLSEGKTREWLLRILGDAGRRPALKQHRKRVGKPEGAFWNPYGVASWLADQEHMTKAKCKQAMKQEYPEYFDRAFDD